MSDLESLTYDSDRLIREWRERYTGRRTVPWQMLNDAEVLVRDAISRERELERRQAKAEREWELERRERQVEYAEGRHEQQVDRLRRELAEAREKISSLSPRQTLMREQRETVEDGVHVRISAPTVPGYGDRETVRPWTLGELETVMYRLRTGGAEDDTEVRFARDHVEACIPFPEMVLEPRKPSPASVVTRDPGRLEAPRWLVMTNAALSDWRLAWGLVLAVLAVAVGAVIL